MSTDHPESSADLHSKARPLAGNDLKQALETLATGVRLESAYSCFLLAGLSLGFARTAVPDLLRRSESVGNSPLSAALKHLATSLTQKAVLDAAATYDQAGEGADSIANSLNLITRILKASTVSAVDDRKAALKLVEEIRHSVISEKSVELQTLQFWRNKWAGHRTSDATVDPWAKGNPLDFSVIETSLEQMRSAFYSLAILLDQLPELADLEKEAQTIDENSARLSISLEGTANWEIDTTVEMGRRQGREFLRLISTRTQFEHP